MLAVIFEIEGQAKAGEKSLRFSLFSHYVLYLYFILFYFDGYTKLLAGAWRLALIIQCVKLAPHFCLLDLRFLLYELHAGYVICIFAY